MSWFSVYWRWRGRLNRLQFLFGMYSLAVPATIILMVLLPLIAPPAPGGGYVATREVWILIWLLQLLPAPLQASMVVRRLHDLGLSARWLVGWLALMFAFLASEMWIATHALVQILLLMPLILAAFWLVFTPGQPKENQFGPPPRTGWLP